MLLIGIAVSVFGQKAVPIFSTGSYSVFADSVTQAGFTATANGNTAIFSNYISAGQKEKSDNKMLHWQLSKDIAAYPQYHSSFAITDAIYNLSLEEMINAIEPDSTFRTGRLWSGVWTRDISYSIILSMAYLQPKVAMNSLLRKVNKKERIIQDTGTGGAYPCSTDRMIWAVAAWEIYKATGNKEWLQRAFRIIKNSIEDDTVVAYDAVTGLVKGESSFLDWREQTYPAWMQPADIFESECLGTNAVHFQANIVLSQMALLLKDAKTAQKHAMLAATIKAGINKYLWLPAAGYYGQFLYGRNYKIVSPRAEALGEALCVLWNIADKQQQRQIIVSTPVTEFGIPCIFPQIPGIPPYHNNAVWPFVQTFWAWAAAKVGNEMAMLASMAAIYRPAALFATNKENFVAATGDFDGTQINSSNMLWSLSGNISLVHRLLFGIHFNKDSLSFEPFVPAALNGERRLDNFVYRDAILNITMSGYGNRITAVSIDGKPMAKASLASSLRGTHAIHIQLAGNDAASIKVNKQPVYFSVAAPEPLYGNGVITWPRVDGAVAYQILKNGRMLVNTVHPSFRVTERNNVEYQVMATDSNKTPSFASEPLLLCNAKDSSCYQLEVFIAKSSYDYKGYSGEGFAETSVQVNPLISLPVTIAADGWYSIDFRYANGNGPVNTENKCAIRTFKVDHKAKGCFVFPQRGTAQWSNWGFSNPVRVYLKAGMHSIELSLMDADDNMNLAINQAMLDYMRVIRLVN